MTRRPSGQGSVSRDRNRPGRKQWVARLRLPNGDHKRGWFATEEEAEAALLDWRYQSARGIPVPTRETRVSDWLRHWLTTLHIEPVTLSGYRCAVERHLIPALGRLTLTALTVGHVERFLADQSRPRAGRPGGYAPKTVKEHHRALAQALDAAMAADLIGRNVAKLTKPPTQKRPKINAPSIDEARRLLAAVTGHRLEALFALSLAIGTRQSEALGLKWEDIDLEAGGVSIRRTLKRHDGEYHLAATKNEHSQRDLIVPAWALSKLREHRWRQIEQRLAIGSAWVDRGLVFTAEDGGPLHRDHVKREFAGCLKRAGLRRITFYTLRHWAASLLLSEGEPIWRVSRLLGHSSLQTTSDLYGHLTREGRAETARTMERLLGEESG
jgi:integrase